MNPLGRSVEEVGAAAQAAVVAETVAAAPGLPAFGTAPGASTDAVVFNSYDTELLRGRKAPSSGWLHAPAYLELLRTADERLTRVSEMLGAPVASVSKVRAARVLGKRVVYIFPTHDEDPDGIPVYRYGSGAWINLITLLGPARQTVAKGYRSRYAVEFAPEGSPVGPALMVNLARPMGRKVAKKRRPQIEEPQE